MGDHNSLKAIREEIRRAKRSIPRSARWNLGLKWMTYFSLPIAVAEAIVQGFPIVGTSLTVISTIGTVRSSRMYNKNEWVLFGM